ncbi:FxsA family protein [Natronospora cellulosivora (SeqCode)]
MFIKLLLLFTMVPLIELALLIKVGEYIGVIPTVFLVAVTGLVGVSLARGQGYLVIKRIKLRLNNGNMPADDLIGGLLILIGGTMLLTPGLITDITGFSLIIPATRKIYAKVIKNKFNKYIKRKSFNFRYQTPQDRSHKNIDDDYIDINIEPEE